MLAASEGIVCVLESDNQQEARYYFNETNYVIQVLHITHCLFGAPALLFGPFWTETAPKFFR
jgi:hypothetical protein